MSIIVLKLPDIKSEPDGRPEKCPSCGDDLIQRWGGQKKRLRNPQVKQAVVYRYRCCRCRHTFRHYPVGVDQAQQSQRLRNFAAACWRLGLSYRGIEMVLGVLGIRIDNMTAWRDLHGRSRAAGPANGSLRQRRLVGRKCGRRVFGRIMRYTGSGRSIWYNAGEYGRLKDTSGIVVDK